MGIIRNKVMQFLAREDTQVYLRSVTASAKAHCDAAIQRAMQEHMMRQVPGNDTKPRQEG
jgi:hypothetical protein